MGRNENSRMDAFQPIAWYHEYDGGRAFYTGLALLLAEFGEQGLLDHIYAGIQCAAKGKEYKINIRAIFPKSSILMTLTD